MGSVILPMILFAGVKKKSSVGKRFTYSVSDQDDTKGLYEYRTICQILTTFR